MGRNRFVTPEVVRLPLSEGDWIDVKRELNAGEERNVIFAQMKTMNFGEPAKLDPLMVGKGQMVEYVVGWSFVDAHGVPVPYSPAALDSLDTNAFSEIRQAVDAHVEAVEARREERKKTQDGATVLPAISPSAA